MKEESHWWKSLLMQPIRSIIDVHGLPEYSMVNVSGILGHVCMEEKVVRSEPRGLMIMRILDRTGGIEVRSWTHKIEDFSNYRDRPILLKRVRVTAYAGTKMLELCGDGSIFEHEFPFAADLAAFWREPAE